VSSSHGPDYRIRPAKAVLRRILLETLDRLRGLADLTEYEYYGLGSYSFVDFSLFHRRLKFPSMVSMERDLEVAKRAEFNTPFSCIRVARHAASTELAQLPSDRKTVVWLDYTDPLDETVVKDLGQFATRAAPGSFLAVSVRIEEEDDPRATAAHLERSVGREFASSSVTLPTIVDGNLPRVLQGCVENVVLRTLRDRNAGLFGTADEILFKRVFGLTYSDSTRMLCTAGILHSVAQRERVGKCGFEALDFFQKTDDPPNIRVPALTPKELFLLNSLLPTADWTKLKDTGVGTKDADAYRAIYRYYPPFVEAELY
jgi:hypothetical protein